MDALLICSPHTSLSQIWKNIKSESNLKHIKDTLSKPAFIAECDYQVESSNMDDVHHPPPSPSLSFKQLSEDCGHETRDNTSGVAPTTFTCFKDLPTEIRLQIWGMACGQKRNVSVGNRTLISPGDLPSYTLDGLFVYESRTPVPEVLSVCRESREEAMKHYSLCFGTKLNNSVLSIEVQPRIWCNFKADTICVDLDFKLSWISQHYENFFMKCAIADMSSLAFNISHLISCSPLTKVCNIDWTNIFRIVDAYGAQSSNLREIILYFDSDEIPRNQSVGSEFGELDWIAMDPDCEKAEQLQVVQKDLLRDFPEFWRSARDYGERRFDIWGDIQSKVRLMELKVNHR